MARGQIKPKPDVAVSSGIETGLTYELLKMLKDDSEVQRKKVKEMESEIRAYRELVNKASDVLLLTEVDGTPVDGFRFREMILELKESINNYKNNK